MSKKTQNILLVGAGKMGGAMLGAWTQDPSLSITILDPGLTPYIKEALESGATHIQSATYIPADIDTVVIAIKPQMFEGVAPDLSSNLDKNALIISILAGTSLERLEAHFSANPIIRAMPNTPAAIGKGITAITGNTVASKQNLSDTEQLLAACGSVIAVENETLIDSVTAISGSGPAYVFYLVEALTSAGIELGLETQDAESFARQMVVGAGALLETSDESADQLRKNVTSPNGTTQAGLEVLMSQDALTSLIKKTTKAAFDRAQELAKE